MGRCIIREVRNGKYSTVPRLRRLPQRSLALKLPTEPTRLFLEASYMTSRPKSKPVAHVIDNRAIELVRRLLPAHWTVRDYRPDYGIDLAVEVFEKKSVANACYETLGEHFFVQVKGTENIIHGSQRIRARHNVEIGNREAIPGSCEEDTISIDVVKFSLDTALLATVQRMSNAVPVMLFVVDVNSELIYFVNLNDYIDKVLLPHDPAYTGQTSKVISIPAANVLSQASNSNSMLPLRFYAKRPKYYSFFNKVAYQNNHLQFVSEHELVSCLKRFAQVLMGFDIWDDAELWPLLAQYKDWLIRFSRDDEIGMIGAIADLDDEREEWQSEYSHGRLYTRKQLAYYGELRLLWDRMRKLYNIYEEICRESFLPTMLNEITN